MRFWLFICSVLVLFATPWVQAQEFVTEPSLKDALLTERSGERLSVELGCPDDPRPCGGRFVWDARKCWGDIGGIQVDRRTREGRLGSMELVELMRRRGSCDRGRHCSIMLDRGWGRYTRVCDGKVVATGRFDKGRNVEMFGDRVDKREFYPDPNAAAVAAAIPPPPATLADNKEEYKARFAALPPKLLDLAAAGRPIQLADFDIRDVVDAVMSVDSRAWRADGFINGSVTEAKAEVAGGVTTVRAKYVYSSFAYSNGWREGTVQIRFVDGRPECITYWNNRTCSANYDMFANPNADRSLTAEHRRCIKIGTGTAVRELPRRCVVVEVKTGICVQSGDAEFKDVDYQQIENSCDRSFEVVLACPLLRQRLTLPAKSVTPAPGISGLGCHLERMPTRP